MAQAEIVSTRTRTGRSGAAPIGGSSRAKSGSESRSVTRLPNLLTSRAPTRSPTIAPPFKATRAIARSAALNPSAVLTAGTRAAQVPKTSPARKKAPATAPAAPRFGDMTTLLN
ncbi:hypothetical protein GCM10009780_29700 [Actinomadura alba]